MNIPFDYYKIFYYVAKHKSFTKAAEELYISQPNITRTIKKLEEMGFETLNILIEENPYILNLDDYEVENYITKRLEKGEKQKEIVEDMTLNPLLFNEV